MKKLIIAASIAASCSFAAQADDHDVNGPYFNLGVNYFNYESNRGVEDDGSAYLGLGYQLNSHWGTEFEYTEVPTKTKQYGFDIDIALWTVNTVYRHQPRGDSSVFWKFGLGRFSENFYDTDETALRLGVGYDFALSEKASWVIGLDSEHTGEAGGPDWSVYGGISYFFGGTSKKAMPKPAAKPVPVAPKDSDNDGVIDSMDQCPTTPAGAKVDSKGCELDSDADGVVDSKDKCKATPAGAKVDADGCRIQLSEDVSIKLHVNFANNSNVVTDAYRNEISKVADFMRQYPDTNVVIEGHTDSRGSAQYNQQLSQRRATAVMEYLVKTFNVEASRVTAEGKGEESPIADNNTAAGRAENRRVQAEIKTTVTK